MSKWNVALVSGLLALAAVLGTLAATRTASLGTAHRKSADAAVQSRVKQLDRFQASLQKALANKPPALPKISPAPSAPLVNAAAAPAASPRIVYHRPPPVVVVKHRPGGHESEGGFESEGGGGND